MSTKREYEDAKADYHAAGRKAKGKHLNSQEQQDYLKKRAAYQRIGSKLREENKK
jgi:hypothetical protein